MADPIPVVDAALLAAQARAGQAGVDAYKAAQTELQKQRQSSVELAMQEAALRGAPAGAAQQVQSTATAPYDQRIASLSQASAAFQGDMAGRDRRMADYNAAVNAARSYIPQVTEQIVAPIRAEGEYRVRGIERGGEAKVSEIEANQRLTEAKMAAAFQAAMIQAAKDAADKAAKAAKDAKKPELNKTELESELFGRAKERVQASTAAARNIVEGNAREVNNKTQAATQRVRSGSSGTVARNNEDAFKRMFANIASTAMAVDLAKLKQQEARSGPLPTRVPVTFGTGMGGAGGLSIPVNTGQRQAGSAWEQMRNPWASQPSTPPTDPALAARIKALENGIRTNQFRASQGNENIERREGRANANITSSRTSAVNSRSFVEPTTGRRVMMTPAQLSMFDPFDQDTILNATNYGDLRTGADVDRIIGGTPGERGRSSPYSAEVIRNAMIQAAQDLVDDGYEINDAELRNALGDAESYRPGQSLYDSMARERGQPTGEEEYSNAEDDEADRRRDENYQWSWEGREGEILDAQADVDEESAESDARQAIMSRYGYMPSSSFGDPIELANRIQSGNFQNSEQKLAEIFEARNKDYIDDEVEEAMIDVGIPAEDRRLLKEFYPG